MKVSFGALSFMAMLAMAPAAQAQDFYATPLSPGAPTNLPGEHLVPGLSEALGIVNGVTQPLLQPILVPGAAATPAVAAAPVPHHHWRHRVASRLHHGHHKIASGLHRHAHRTA